MEDPFLDRPMRRLTARSSLAGSFTWLAGGFVGAALLFPWLPDLGMIGRIFSFMLLTLLVFPALLPWINLRTHWYYLLLIAPTAMQAAVLLFLLFPFGWLTALGLNLLILTYAYALGKLLGKRVTEPSLLLVILVISTVADLLSVFFGPAGHVIDSQLAPFVLLSFPVPGQPGVDWFLGFGDVFLFILLSIFSLKQRFGNARTLFSQLAALNVASLISAALQIVIPALPFQCLAFYLVHRERLAWRPGKREFRLLVFGFVVSLLIIIIFHRLVPVSPVLPS